VDHVTINGSIKRIAQETISEINDVTTGDEIKQEIKITEHVADEKKIIEEIA
jgi:ribosomal protein L19